MVVLRLHGDESQNAFSSCSVWLAASWLCKNRHWPKQILEPNACPHGQLEAFSHPTIPKYRRPALSTYLIVDHQGLSYQNNMANSEDLPQDLP